MSEACLSCPYKGAPRVGTKGPEDSPFVIVGESPGIMEVAKGLPFVGNSGKLLHAVLEECHFPKDIEPYFVNAIECLPRNKDQNNLKEACASCSLRARDLVGKYPRKLILALGNAALWSMTDNYNLKITSTRGKLIPSNFAEHGILAAIHPAALLRGTGNLPQFRMDIKYAVGLLSHGNEALKLPDGGTYSIARDAITVQRIAKEIQSSNLCAGDVETSHLHFRKGRVLCLGLQYEPGHVWIVPGEFIIPELFNDRTRYVWHNGKFDVKWLREHYNAPAVVDEDTMLLSYTLNEKRGLHDLDQVASDWLGATDHKDMIKEWLPNKDASYELVPPEVLYKYLALDIQKTYQLYYKLRPLVAEQKDLNKLYTKVLIPASEYLSRVEMKGMKVDLEWNQTIRKDLLKEVAELWDKLDAEAVKAGMILAPIKMSKKKKLEYDRLGEAFFRNKSHAINPNSPIQVKKLLYERLKLAPVSFATDVDTLEALPAHPAVAALIRYREIHKAYSTYVKGLPDIAAKDPKDGTSRVHTTFLLHGTGTGRLASREPNCYSEDTEVLTSRGWMLFKDLPRDLPVAQYHADGTIDFVTPSDYICYPYNGAMVHVSAFAVNLLVTPNHRMVYHTRISNNRTGPLCVEEAGSWVNKWKPDHNTCRKFIRGGLSKGTRAPLSAQERQLLAKAVALQAEGEVSKAWPNHIKLRLTSERKRAQLKALYPNVTQYTDPQGTLNEFVWVNFTDPECSLWLTLPDKNFNTEELLKLNADDLAFFIKQVHQWDGDFTKEHTFLQHRRRTTTLDAVQAAALLSGQSTSWYEHSEDYAVVNFHPNPIRAFGLTNITQESYSGNVYCVTVPTGMLIVRRDKLAVVCGNCQNIPRHPLYRGQFIADDGFVFLEPDLSQAELRSLACLSGDPGLIEIFCATNRSLHDEVATEFFGKGFDEEQKMIAKNVNFGIVYGITNMGLYMQLDTNGIATTMAECQSYIDRWYARFPVAHEFILACRDSVLKGTTITTIFGRKKRHGVVARERLKDLQNEASNFPHQSIASDITLTTGARIQPTIEALGAYAQNTVHDSILVGCPRDVALINKVGQLMIDELQATPRMIGLTKVPFRAEIKVGLRWGSVKAAKKLGLANAHEFLKDWCPNTTLPEYLLNEQS